MVGLLMLSNIFLKLYLLKTRYLFFLLTMENLKKRLASLEEAFLLNGGGGKNHTIWDLFEIKDWVYGKNRQYETIFSESVDWSIPVISWTTYNNWINFYTKDKLEANEVFEDEITINTRWDAWKAFYHSWKFALANNILVLKTKGLNKFHKLYLATCFSKLRYGGYNNYPTINSLKEDIISLPTLSNWELAYDYMENYIKEIEAYLKATGLSSYELNKDEVESLKTITQGGG